MTSNQEKARYVVYLPDGPTASTYPFRVEEAEVADLERAIHDLWDEERGLKGNRILLFQCGTLNVLPKLGRIERVTGWIRDLSDTELEDVTMEASHRLERYFPVGPAPQTEEKIDIVVLTEPFLNSIRMPTTPENKTIPEIKAFTDYKSTPRKSEAETQGAVTVFLSSFDTRLIRYLSGPVWREFWDAPLSADADRETASFINNLKIPKIEGAPVLLLHGLGEGIVDQSVVNEVFADRSKFLVNTPGSGKTRLLFEGLTRHWGLYFTTVVNQQLGSKDIMQVIERISKSTSFTRQPSKLDVEQQKVAFEINNAIAERRVHEALLARILVFEHFLKMARATKPTRPINEYKKHWLFLQLFPFDILQSDLFARLSTLLHDASDDYFKIYEDLIRLQSEYCLDERFFLVLDEAQIALKELDGCFLSKRPHAPSRPVLRPIINSWSLAMDTPIIVSGTGLSIDVVNDVVYSSVAKNEPFMQVTRTGAFDTRERQLDYINRYIPSHITQSESGKELLERAWKFIRGRYRFTAAWVAKLLSFLFQSPHRVLDAYIWNVSGGFCPSDGRSFVDKEGVIIREQIIPTSRLDFSEVYDNPDLIALLTNVMYTWLMQRERHPLDNKQKRLVELGFARFTNTPEAEAFIDEPLVLLAAMNAFRDKQFFSMKGHLLQELAKEPGRGSNFESFVAYYLMCAFGERKTLHDIFDFGIKVPGSWAEEAAELVSISWAGKRAEVHPFHMPHVVDSADSKGSTGFKGSTTVFGCKTRSLEATVKWFQHPTSLMCFPDVYMGPDIVLFIRLASGKLLVVVIQCRWRGKPLLSNSEQDDAVRTVTPSEFYMHRRSKDSESGKKAQKGYQDILNMFRRLNSSFDIRDEWFEGEDLPVLKVIASYPADVREGHMPYCASLNMDKCADLIDKNGLLEALKAALGVKGVKRRAEDEDEENDSTSRKKPCTS